MKKVQDLIKKFGFIVIVFSVFIMTLTSSKVQAAEVTITRAQWLHDLTQLFGITVEQDDYPDNYFNDIDSEDEYYQDIMTAAEFGLVDIEAGEKVRPADPVTREFAVYTMNLCMGYTANAESTYDFDDQSEFIHVNDEKAAEYFNAAQVAIDQGWVELEENKFMPQKNLTLSEKNIMWKDAADYLNSQVIDENYVNKAVFADGVVEIPQTTEYQFDEFNNAKFVTLFNYMDGLKDGDTFALWQNGLPIIYKAVAVENNGSGLVVQISDAEDENSIDELDVQGTIEADLTEAVQAGEGTMTWIEGGRAEKNYMDGREISNPRLAGSKNLTAIKRSKTFTLGDGLSATVNVTIPTPVVNYKVNGIKEVYVAMDADPTVTVTVKGDARESLGLPKSLDLVYIPFGGIGTAKLSVSLEATGQCSLSYKSKVTAGVHYRRGKGTTVVNNFEKKKKPTISARAELDATLTASVGITELPGIDASAWGKVGSRMGLQAWTYEDDKKPAVCMDTWGYLHASAGITMKIASMDLGSKTVVIWDENNSPVRIANHYEDGILRNPCTRGSSNRKYYTSSDSRYFSDASGIYNSDGGTGSESTIQPRYDYTVSKNAQDEDVATITKYYGSVAAIIVPDTIDGYPVVAIGEGAFRGNKYLTAILIPDCITSIGDYAFADTNLDSLVLPAELNSLGRCILSGNKGVTEIVIPKTLSSTGSSYSNLIEGDGPFAESNVQKATIEAGMTVIPEHLFHKNSTLTSVEIPDTVTEISRYAFAQTGLENIELPSSVTTLQYEIFSGGNLLQISIPDSVTGMGNAIFQNCSKLQKVKLPKARYNISDYTFAGCTSLEEIQLPKTVTTIWPHAFDGCSSLKKVEWSDCLESIKDNAFKGCTSLTEIVIPNTVRELGNEAFRNCDGLEKIVIPNSVTTIGNGVLYDCDSLTNISVGAGISKLSESCFEHCDNLEKIVLPYTIKSIDKSAFKECIALKEITIPRNTSSIGTSVFSYPAKMTIYGVAGTYAEKYAGEKGIKFVAIDKKTEKVSLDKSEVTINEGQTVQLSLNVEPKDFTDEVSWKSTDSNIVTVSDTGVVTAENTGTAKIKVIVGEQSVYCNVTVTQPVTSIYLNRESVSMEALETYQLKTSIYPENANNKEVEWNSSDEKIVKVDQTGCITALAKGTATVTGKTKDGSNLWDTCTVTVTNTAYIAKSVDELESPHKYENNCSDYWIYSTESDGDALQITFDPRTEVEDGFDYIHIYSSDGTEVGKYTGTQLSGATINVPGQSVKIKLVSDNAGNEWGFKVTNITSIFEGNEKKEQSIECDDSFVKDREDDVFNLNASLAVGDGILSYVSDDTKVAEVDSDGNVTINGAGSTNIAIIASETENYKETRKYVKITVNESTIKNLADCTIKLEGTSFVYNGNEIMPKVTVCYGTKILQENKAYEVEYINNINPGTATVRITAIDGSGWEGFVSTTFEIKKMPDGLTVEIEPNAFANCENLFNVNIGAKVKKIGDHAFANCKNLKNIYFFGNMPEMAERSFENVSGTAYYPYNDSSWTLDKLENYGGDIVWMPWNPETNEVQKRNLLMCSIEVRQDSCIYTGRPNIPTVMVKDASYILREEKDYTITCYNNINAGAAKIVIQGAGAYSGKYETEYTIQKAQNVITAKEITKNASTKKQSANIGASAYESANLMYTSNNKSVKVSRQGKITISRKFVGSAVITIKAGGTQNYNETSKKITVTVKPLETKISKASNTLKRKVTVKWKKKTSISGYAIQYSTDKKFKAGVKTVNVNGAKKSQKVLSKLKKGKKYYIRIATYKKVGKVKYYSSWSSVKSVKVKK